MGVAPAVTAPRRIGLFGGAFDPPHEAHLALAHAAIDELALDRLHVVPTGDAWHKSRPLSPAVDRLAMCRLAFENMEGVLVDDRELHRAGPTYTIDTLRELQVQYPGAELWLQIGADQAQAFARWRQATQILDIASISIADRAVPVGRKALFDSQDPLPGVVLPAGRSVRLLRMPALTHSATEVRLRVAAGRPIDHLVPAAVARYIAEHQLYRSD